jgi:hypothetical protein
LGESEEIGPVPGLQLEYLERTTVELFLLMEEIFSMR